MLELILLWVVGPILHDSRSCPRHLPRSLDHCILRSWARPISSPAWSRRCSLTTATRLMDSCLEGDSPVPSVFLFGIRNAHSAAILGRVVPSPTWFFSDTKQYKSGQYSARLDLNMHENIGHITGEADKKQSSTSTGSTK